LTKSLLFSHKIKSTVATLPTSCVNAVSAVGDTSNYCMLRNPVDVLVVSASVLYEKFLLLLSAGSLHEPMICSSRMWLASHVVVNPYISL
jgi:hypothetical protein